MNTSPTFETGFRDDQSRLLPAKTGRFDRLMGSVPAVLYEYTIDHDGISRCLYCSPYSKTLLGVAPEEFERDMDVFWNLVHPDDREMFRTNDREANRNATGFLREVRVVLADGEEKWLRVSSRRNPRGDGQPAIWTGYMIDITDSRRVHQLLQQRATHDYLTGLCNRQCYQARFDKERIRAARYGHESAVLLIDLDHFKRVNDCHGHEAGDSILRAVVGRIAEELRSVDVFARWGGEEFSILLPETGTAGAVDVARRILATVAGDPFCWRDAEIAMTASIGVAAVQSPEVRMEQVMDRADRAMYRAKRAGRNRVEIA